VRTFCDEIEREQRILGPRSIWRTAWADGWVVVRRMGRLVL
jgi:hypothetical protein